jgi:hypothetical protein
MELVLVAVALIILEPEAVRLRTLVPEALLSVDGADELLMDCSSRP